MKPEIKARWVAALRSGEYQQGQGQLKTTGGSFCCLGVLCDLAAKDGVCKWSLDKLSGLFGVDEEFEIVPQVVAEWAGLDSCSPDVTPEDEYGKEGLVNLNDCGMPFDKIADLIEAQL